MSIYCPLLAAKHEHRSSSIATEINRFSFTVERTDLEEPDHQVRRTHGRNAEYHEYTPIPPFGLVGVSQVLYIVRAGPARTVKTVGETVVVDEISGRGLQESTSVFEARLSGGRRECDQVGLDAL
jgi:hypothetical protein